MSPKYLPFSEEELADLSAQAGYPLNDRQAFEFLRKKHNAEAVEAMLREKEARAAA